MGGDMVEDHEDLELEDVDDVGNNSPSGLEEQEEAKSGEHEYTVGSYTVLITDRQLPYLGQLIAAIILVVAISLPTEAKNYGYGLTVGILSILFSGFGLFLINKPTLHDQQLMTLPIIGPCNIGKCINLFLVVWWGIAAGVLTFNGPFTVTSNGYFTTWAGFFLSAMSMGLSAALVKDTNNFIRLAACCIIIICAVPATLSGPNYSEGVYAIVLAVLTLAFSVVVLSCREVVSKFMFPITIILAIFWTIEAALTTFRGPFLATGNGYFASWGAAFFSILVAKAQAEA